MQVPFSNPCEGDVRCVLMLTFKLLIYSATSLILALSVPACLSIHGQAHSCLSISRTKRLLIKFIAKVVINELTLLTSFYTLYTFLSPSPSFMFPSSPLYTACLLSSPILSLSLLASLHLCLVCMFTR